MDTSSMKRVVMQKSIHHDQRVLCLHFERDVEIENAVKKLPACRWSENMKCWYLPNTTPHFRQVLEKLRPLAYIAFSEVIKKTVIIPKEKTPAPTRIIARKQTSTAQVMASNYSKKTTWKKDYGLKEALAILRD